MKKKAFVLWLLVGGVVTNVLVLSLHKKQDLDLKLANVEVLSAYTLELDCDGGSDAVCENTGFINGIPIKIQGTGEFSGTLYPKN
ncbi:MAG: hypothetical protein J1F42_12435 [Lachnospiraceae bacterium]|nr:hypothetical protein [Lachnospiraceae bacterium]